MFCLCTVGLAHGQVYITEGLFNPTGVNNDGLVVGAPNQVRPHYLWNPHDGSMTLIGGVSAGNGIGGVARFSGDGKYVYAPMQSDAIGVVTEWTKATYDNFKQITFTDVYYVSDYSLYAVGASADGKTPVVVYSTNNGTSWRDYNQGNPFDEGGLVCISSLSFYCVLIGGHNGNIYRNHGNGDWRKLDIKPEGDDGVVDTYWAMDFIPGEYDEASGMNLDATYGVIGVEYTDGSYSVWQTSDSGDSFVKATGVSGVPQYITHTGKTYFMVTKNGKIQKSDDYGKTWNDVFSAGEGVNLYRIRFADDKKGIATADNVVYITRDGGMTWKQTEVLPAGIWTKTQAADEGSDNVAWNDARWVGNEIVVIGTQGNAYRSTDDGETFAKMNFDKEFTGACTAVYYDARGVYNILADGGQFYRKAQEETISGYGAGRYDIENDTWTPLKSSGYNRQEVASSPYDVSGDGNAVVGTAHYYNEQVNAVNTHATVWLGDEMIDLGSRNDATNRASRANGVSYDGSVVVGWQDQWGPWFASVWRRGADGAYTQSMLLKDKGKTEADVDFTSQADMSANLLGYCQAVSDDGKWIGGTGKSTYYAVPGAWLWNEEEGVIQLTESEGCVAAISNDGSKAVGWMGIGSSAWIWTKEDGLRYLQDYVTEELGCDLGDFYIMSVYDMSPNGRYLTGYGMRGQQPLGYVIDLEGKGTSIEDKVVSQTKASVYPNPVSDELHIDLPYGAEDVKTTLTLVDMQGCAVRRVETVQTSNIINVSNLPQGIYILDVNARGSHKAFKVVVKH